MAQHERQTRGPSADAFGGQDAADPREREYMIMPTVIRKYSLTGFSISSLMMGFISVRKY